MPWTFAHPAIMLPLRQCFAQPIFFTAAIFGSLMPDFNYYLETRIPAIFGWGSHSLFGSALLACSFGFLCLALVMWSASILCAPLPNPHRAKVFTTLQSLQWPSTLFTWQALFACLILGAWSHVFWDAWTHRTGYFSRLLSLHQVIYGTPIFRWLQHASTALAYVYSQSKSSTNQFEGPALREAIFWSKGYGFILLLAITTIAAAAVGWSDAMRAESVYFWRVFYFRTAVAGTQILGVLWLVCGALRLWQEK
jgi:hypothetical protein